MRLVDSFRLARGNLKRARLRTFLTTAGVVVSIGAIVLLVSLGVGLQKLSIGRIASINALTRLTIMPGETGNPKIDEKMLKTLDNIPHVEFVSPELQIPSRVTFLDTDADIMAVGIRSKYLNFSDITLDKGKVYKNDNTEEALVSKAVLKLFGKENDPEGVIGKEMTFKLLMIDADKKVSQKNIKAKVVGTTTDESLSSVYLPLDLVSGDKAKEYSAASIKVDNRQYVKDVKGEVEKLGFQTTTVSDLIDQIDQAFLYFQIILAAIGGIALFVAAIGIINTMTISLLERTHEIGIMKAVGARDSDVRRVFTLEAGLIGLSGGAIGVVSGWLFGQAINVIINVILRMNGQEEKIVLFIIPIWFALSILFFSVVLACLAGVYPARRAAKLSPLQALRYQ